MAQITIDDAAHRLRELIRDSQPGDEIILTEDSRPVAKIVPLGRAPRRAGTAAHLPHFMADDFAATPPEFADYLP